MIAVFAMAMFALSVSADDNGYVRGAQSVGPAAWSDMIAGR